MNRLNDLDYLKLNKFQAFFYNLKLFFCAIPSWLWGVLLSLFGFLKNCWNWLKDEILDIGRTFKHGNWAVKLSFFIFGFGNLFYGQILRGILFLLFEIIFIVYMILPSGGIHWLGKANFFQTGATVGDVPPLKNQYDPIMDSYYTIWGDDSVKVLLYALLTVIFIIAFNIVDINSLRLTDDRHHQNTAQQ